MEWAGNLHLYAFSGKPYICPGRDSSFFRGFDVRGDFGWTKYDVVLWQIKIKFIFDVKSTSLYKTTFAFKS